MHPTNIPLLTITQPDDWHIHLREGQAMRSVVAYSARQMGRGVIMPNLSNPIINANQAEDYRQAILAALPDNSGFIPLMTLYLTNNTSPDDIKTAKQNPYIIGAKLYPAGTTTNSDKGVSDINKIYPTLQMMQTLDMVLLVHGEVVDHAIDVFDREAVFIDTTLTKLSIDFPDLRIIFEHITTKQAVDFVQNAASNIAATITPQHLLNNRNDMLVGGIRPHLFCLPILKRKNPHQRALIAAATSGNAKFFLGTDSAPHTQHNKETACGCAGIFSAHIAIELYALAFEKANALDKLEGFASQFGADFYKLPRNTKTITLSKTPQTIPASYDMAGEPLIGYFAGQEIPWTYHLS